MSADSDLVALVIAVLVRGERIDLTTPYGEPVTLTYVPRGLWRRGIACYLLRIGPPGAHKELVAFTTAEEGAAALIENCTAEEVRKALSRFE